MMHMDQELKDKLLESLIEKMEDIMAGDMDPKKGLSVEVAAPDKEHLADGLDKAKDVVEHSPVASALDKMAPEAPKADDEESGDGRSDAERLAELLGDDGDDDDDEEKC